MPVVAVDVEDVRRATRRLVVRVLRSIVLKERKRKKQHSYDSRYILYVSNYNNNNKIIIIIMYYFLLRYVYFTQHNNII
jgi:hypothetical protein